MLFRNLMAMDVEESHPLLPARRRRAARRLRQDRARAADGRGQRRRARRSWSPAARRRPAYFRGRELGAGTDLWHYADELRAGRMTQAGVRRARGRRDAVVRPLQRAGHRVDDGGAGRGARHVPAGHGDDPRRRRRPHARRRGDGRAAPSRSRARACAPSPILTADAFDNAITLLMALGGGTNAVVHLLALAGRVGVPLDARSLRRARRGARR